MSAGMQVTNSVLRFRKRQPFEYEILPEDNPEWIWDEKLEFKESGIVLVNNPADNDRRVKLWVDNEDWGGFAGGVPLGIISVARNRFLSYGRLRQVMLMPDEMASMLEGLVDSNCDG